MNNKELKPCPFCGGEADIHTYEDMLTDKNYTEVVCGYCGVGTKGDTQSEAIKAWNTRNNPKKQDSSNTNVVETGNCKYLPKNIGEKVVDAIVENKLFSVINPRTNKEIKETLIVWSSMTDEILEAVIAKEFFKSRKIGK